MATKADFTPEEWDTLRFGVADAMAYLSAADPGFWDTFKEAGAAGTYITKQRESSDPLVHDLAMDMKPKADSEISHNPTAMPEIVAKRVAEAVAIVSAKAPESLQQYKDLVLGVATAAAEAAKGVSEGESDALDKIKAALGEA